MAFRLAALLSLAAIAALIHAAAFPLATFWLVDAAFFGACVGSFLNVVAYRFPIMLKRQWTADCHDFLELPAPAVEKPFNLAFPKSHCPSCDRPIRKRELMPIFSYAALRGKCAGCANPIGVRYALVEMLCAVLTTCVVAVYGPTPASLAAGLFVWVSLAIALIDADTYIIPDELSQPLVWAGLLLSAAGIGPQLLDAVAGAAVGYGFLWTICALYKLLRGREGMGNGDFKYLAACGAFLGWKALFVVIGVAGVTGAVTGIVSAMRNKEASMSKQIPFGPHLVIGAVLALLAQPYVTKHFPLFPI